MSGVQSILKEGHQLVPFVLVVVVDVSSQLTYQLQDALRLMLMHVPWSYAGREVIEFGQYVQLSAPSLVEPIQMLLTAVDPSENRP